MIPGPSAQAGGAAAPWRAAFRPLGPVGGQAIAQVCNLGGQLAAIAWVGPQDFGSVGLGLMAAAVVVFLGDLGYGPYMLRESAARGGEWLPEWRVATAHRLIVLAAGLAVAAVVVRATAPDPVTGSLTVMAAGGGVLASAFLPQSLLFGLGRARAAVLGQIFRYVVQGGLLAMGALLAPQSLAVLGGLAFTFGIAIQVLGGLVSGLPAAFLRPSWGYALPPAPALRLWGLSVVGTLNDRTLPFVIAVAAPGILAWQLIAVQVLQGLAGILAQVDRLVVPTIARGQDSGKAPIWLLIGVTGALAVAVAMAGAKWHPALIAPALLMLTEWHCVMMGAWSFPVLFARNAEQKVAVAMVSVLVASVAIQVMTAGSVGLLWLLAFRAAVAAGIGRFCAISAGMPVLAAWWPVVALAAAALVAAVAVP